MVGATEIEPWCAKLIYAAEGKIVPWNSFGRREMSESSLGARKAADPTVEVDSEDEQKYDVEHAQIAQLTRPAKEEVERKVDGCGNLRVALDDSRQMGQARTTFQARRAMGTRVKAFSMGTP
jgi:hypothetical protein